VTQINTCLLEIHSVDKNYNVIYYRLTLKMSAYPYECDICETSRPTDQMRKCLLCETKGDRCYIGYCCIDKHNKDTHDGASLHVHVKSTKKT
jgi:hypothetical protein